MRTPNALLCFAAALGLGVSCASAPAPAPASREPVTAAVDATPVFKGLDGCFLAWDLKADRPAGAFGGERCKVRLAACSTFKVPLAVMAFDAGVLTSEDEPYAWDGVPRSIESWNRDHTARTWMANSVVWFSQRLTPKLGAERIARYLDGFEYGNRDFSAGLTSAWLTITKTDADPGRGSLKISAEEQLAFLRRLWRSELPVRPEAMAKARELTRLETSPHGFTLHGKTGSGYPDGLQGDFGWFVGHVEGGGRELVFAASVTRGERDADARFPGLYVKEALEGRPAGQRPLVALRRDSFRRRVVPGLRAGRIRLIVRILGAPYVPTDRQVTCRRRRASDRQVVRVLPARRPGTTCHRRASDRQVARVLPARRPGTTCRRRASDRQVVRVLPARRPGTTCRRRASDRQVVRVLPARRPGTTRQRRCERTRRVTSSPPAPPARPPLAGEPI
ncbi:MAG: penicillin-binding transpeptidase domain-containing protein [Myxococcales bacterium]